MNRGPLIFLGVFVAMAFSWYGMIVSPQRQIGGQQQATVEPAGIRYPVPRPGLAQRGAEVYRANGCGYCHTQQVRPRGYGSDFERGWGLRMSVAQDFLFEQPAMLGQLRIGPDLANVGMRWNDPQWHYRHLYNPKSTVEKSTMPQFPFLFEMRVIQGDRSPEALDLTGELAPPKGYEVIPKQEARALAAYLISLQSPLSLFEAPIPAEPKKDAEPSTNTVAVSSRNSQMLGLGESLTQ
ncbi:MAG: cbb3-type cytochrome c oxidase subunit II [Verrucomicrobia bacterium]|nr:cbb3-type cytochrome c oxidase subunit II [Verrucomicrobiota bacterium]